jgi:hypothetical protein
MIVLTEGVRSLCLLLILRSSAAGRSSCPPARVPIAAIAKGLGISESCLRRWMDQADIDEGHKEGLSRDERAELVRCRCSRRTSAAGPATPAPPSTPDRAYPRWPSGAPAPPERKTA